MKSRLLSELAKSGDRIWRQKKFLRVRAALQINGGTEAVIGVPPMSRAGGAASSDRRRPYFSSSGIASQDAADAGLSLLADRSTGPELADPGLGYVRAPQGCAVLNGIFFGWSSSWIAIPAAFLGAGARRRSWLGAGKQRLADTRHPWHDRKGQVAVMFSEEKPHLAPLPLETLPLNYQLRRTARSSDRLRGRFELALYGLPRG